MQPVKKQRNYILIAFLIPVIIAALFSCSPVKSVGNVATKPVYSITCNNDTLTVK